ncbi:MAG: TonB-dependent siderophore receptor, partial [Moorea sp. SIO2I5]|nr:TonB-dependent siderophore receptor [Moorena sp. SIO2I5]
TSDNSLLYRLNALYSREDSFRDFDQELERFFVAPALTWNISEKTNLTASLQYIDSELPADTGIVASGNEVIDVPRSRNLGELEDIIESSSLQVSYDFEHRFSDNWKVRNAFRFLQEEESFDSAFVFDFDEDSGNVSRAFSNGIEKRDTYEIQTNIVGKFATGPIDHKLLFGVDYTRTEIPERAVSADFTPLPPFNAFDPVYGLTPRPDPSTVPLFFDQSQTTTDTVGIYIQDQIDILDNLILLLGGRFDFFDQDAPFRGTVTNQYEEAFSPRLGLVYQPIQEVSLYTSYSRSFLPNFRRNSSGEFIEPEKGEQFEVGSRAELLEGRFVANLAFFHLTKQNVGVPDPNFPSFFGFAVAFGEQRSQGIELDLSGEILPGWDLIANYAYLDTEITEDNSGLEGNRLFGVPEHSINLWSVYEIQSGDLQGLNFGIGFNFVGERFGDNANSFELDSYFLTNAAIAYRRDNWRVGLNFRNLFDVNYIESAANSRIAVLPGEGFTMIGSVSIEF